MSLPSLEKYLQENPVIVPSGTQDTTVIVVSDSKGRYLQRQVQNTVPERNIIWESQPGRSSQQAADFILYNINSWKSKYGKILILVWTGTCDLTHKIKDPSDQSSRPRKKFIDLNSIAIEDIIHQYNRVLILNSPQVKVIILEVPYYSISIWNYSRGCLNSDFYREKDKILQGLLDQLNCSIKSLNQLNNFQAPRFSLDLIRHRKAHKKIVKTVSYSLLLADGIHPGEVLCKHWIRRIVVSVICKFCFH